MGNYDFELDLKTRNTMSLINGWIREKSTVLEFGPANGRLTRYLSDQKNCSMTIVEISGEDGKEAAKYAEEAYLGEEDGDIERYHWRATQKKFDYIILADVLEHLRNPKEVLRNCSEVLKEDGKILVSIPNMAHNSILIDLYKDEFNYGNTGLLDKTHVHFFTHTSFLKMIKETDLFVYQTEPIYSRVGNNEIANTYFDIPTDVTFALRNRKTGSIYQYVFMLGKEEDRQDESVTWEEIDKYEDQESTCYWTGDENEEMTREKSVSRIYNGEGAITLVFELPENAGVREIRWDPLEYSSVILVEECKAELDDGTLCDLSYLESNAEFTADKLFYFSSSDPVLYYGLGNAPRKVRKVIFKFCLLQYRMDERQTLLYQKLAEREYVKRADEITRENAKMKKIIEQNRRLILAADTIRHPVAMWRKWKQDAGRKK